MEKIFEGMEKVYLTMGQTWTAYESRRGKGKQVVELTCVSSVELPNEGNEKIRKETPVESKSSRSYDALVGVTHALACTLMCANVFACMHARLFVREE